MIRIYRRFWLVNWAEQWQYRANLLMYLLYWLVSPIVYLAVWTSVARGQGSISGLTAADFTNYYLVLLVVDVLTSEITVHILGYKIQDGTLSNDLLRPVHPILTGTFVNNLAFKALTIIGLVPIWLVLALLFRPDYSSVTLGSLLLAIPALAIGLAVCFLLGATITCLAFWTTRVMALHEFYYAFGILFSGQFVPLDLMPPFIRQAAQFLPFQLYRYFPVELILGKLSPQTIALDFAQGIAWLVVAYILFQLTWRAGVKRFSAVGA
ncbi:MAG TPA: ABC-2 family transporter protein [Anaerolineae bacterium]